MQDLTKRKPGRPAIYGGEMTCFTPGLELTALIEKVQKEMKAHKMPFISKSFIFRKGAFTYCQKLLADLRKAKNGVLHAKDRKEMDEACRLSPRRRAALKKA